MKGRSWAGGWQTTWNLVLTMRKGEMDEWQHERRQQGNRTKCRDGNTLEQTVKKRVGEHGHVLDLVGVEKNYVGKARVDQPGGRILRLNYDLFFLSKPHLANPKHCQHFAFDVVWTNVDATLLSSSHSQKVGDRFSLLNTRTPRSSFVTRYSDDHRFPVNHVIAAIISPCGANIEKRERKEEAD